MAAASKEMVERPGAVCEWMAARGKQVQGWLAGVAAWQGGASARSNPSSVPGPQGLPADIFSHFEFPGSGITTPIEPLVGHLRDPLAPQCNRSSTVEIESRAHILLLGLSPQQFRQLYPGRALLMDFGSSDFRTSVHWLMQRYAELGVQFDEIWAYELKQMDLNQYWASVPADAKLRLHFLNEGIQADPTSAEHPIHLIRQRVRPGDFLVIKLDIDAAEVELPFMRSIAADAELRGLIGELHFEMHYTHRDMQHFFAQTGGNVTMNDVLAMFGDLRQKGLRLHYWP